MMERAAVPPRTIKKVSDLFWAATFILDFFWGEKFSHRKPSSSTSRFIIGIRFAD
jgi:hypothetical protein